MGGRDVIEAARAIRLECLWATPDVQPVSAIRQVHLGEEKLLLMVAGEEGDVELLLLKPYEEVDHTFAVGAAIHVVTHKNDAIFRLGVDDLPKVFERGKAAVDVTDSECSHVGRNCNHESHGSTQIFLPQHFAEALYPLHSHILPTTCKVILLFAWLRAVFAEVFFATVAQPDT